MTFLYSLFSDVRGQPSTNRFLSVFIIVVSMATWSYTVIISKTWQEPSPELIGLIAVALGAKTWQRKIEQEDQCKKD